MPQPQPNVQATLSEILKTPLTISSTSKSHSIKTLNKLTPFNLVFLSKLNCSSQ